MGSTRHAVAGPLERSVRRRRDGHALPLQLDATTRSPAGAPKTGAASTIATACFLRFAAAFALLFAKACPY
jgi:hypothetical protein